jgi:hypothetical protein
MRVAWTLSPMSNIFSAHLMSSNDVLLEIFQTRRLGSIRGLACMCAFRGTHPTTYHTPQATPNNSACERRGKPLCTLLDSLLMSDERSRFRVQRSSTKEHPLVPQAHRAVSVMTNSLLCDLAPALNPASDYSIRQSGICFSGNALAANRQGCVNTLASSPSHAQWRLLMRACPDWSALSCSALDWRNAYLHPSRVCTVHDHDVLL